MEKCVNIYKDAAGMLRAVVTFLFLPLLILHFSAPAKGETSALYVIRDDSSGGDCELIGNWNSSSKTCRITQDINKNTSGTGIYNAIEIVNNNITLDVDNHSNGINLSAAPGSSVHNSTFTGNDYGISLIGANDGDIHDNEFSGDPVYLTASNGINIFNNHIDESEIQLLASNGCEVHHNTLSGESSASHLLSSGTKAAIYLLGASANSIHDNALRANDSGIELIGASANNIYHNSVTAYRHYGLFLEASNENSIYNNALEGNAVCDGDYFDKRYDYGIYLALSNASEIRENSLSANDVGVGLSGASENAVHHNNISHNDYYGLFIYDPSYKNSAYNNNFSENRLAQILLSFAGVGGVDDDNRFNQEAPTGGNFYDTYSTPAQGCLNANGDNFCDAPYAFEGGVDELPWVRRDGWLSP